MTLFAVGGGPAAAQTALTDDGVRALLNERIERADGGLWGWRLFWCRASRCASSPQAAPPLDASAPVSADTLFEVAQSARRLPRCCWRIW